MLYNEVSDEIVNNIIRQMGAVSITTKQTEFNDAKFKLSNTITIEYTYEKRNDDYYYLLRVAPYPLLIGFSESIDDVISMMQKDLAMFQQAYKSSNFPEFLAIMTKLTEAMHRTEGLFLNYNINPEDLAKIDHNVQATFNSMRDAKNNAAVIPEPEIPKKDLSNMVPPKKDDKKSSR